MHNFIDFLKLDVLVSLPQTFVYWLFCFSFMENRPQNLLKRLVIFTFLHSVYTDALVLILPLPLHLINTILFGLILLFIIFKDISTMKKLYLMLFVMLISISMDSISVGIANYIYGIESQADMIRGNLYQMITIIYPQLLILLIASWFIHKRNVFSAKRLFSIILEGERSTLTKVILIIGVQFILLGALQLFQFTPDRDNQTLNVILIYVLIFVSLLALVSIIRLLIRTREQAVRMTQEVYVEEINDMFTSIRGQRHDFLNHVQVIHTMVQMEKTEQLKAYVSDLVKETREVSEIVHHSSPALAAFVQAKMTVSIGKGIHFTYDLPNNWNAEETNIKVIDIIKIIGNLVDNAFDETVTLPQKERHVHVSIRITGGTIELEVSNRGRLLDTKEKERIFLPGYSTKGEDHSGLGLAIVLERVKYYKGTLQIQSDIESGTTVFRVILNHNEISLAI
jgi:signal transduction histidine kinase